MYFQTSEKRSAHNANAKFTVKPNETTLYKRVKKALSESKPFSDSTRSNYSILKPARDLTAFHNDIYQNILEYNKNTMLLSNWLAPFHGLSYSSHDQFRELAQRLTLAMSYIAAEENYNSIDPLIKDGIDQLLYIHIDKMIRTTLFDKKMDLVALDYIASHKTSMPITLLNADQNEFGLQQLSVEYRKVLDPIDVLKDKEIIDLKNKNQQLNQEKNALDKDVKQTQKDIKELQQQFQDFIKSKKSEKSSENEFKHDGP